MRSSLLAILFAAPLALPSSIASCGDKLAGKSTPVAPALSAAPAPSDSVAATALSAEPEEAKPAPSAPIPRLGATVFQTLIMSDMDWPQDGKKAKGERGEKDKAVRLGYLREGATVPVIPEPHRKANCSEGWYELVSGGYVCAKQATLDMNHPKLKTAHPPDRAMILPYQYGVNIRQGEPLYRQVPSKQQRAHYEPWLFPARKPAAPTAVAEPLERDASAEELPDDEKPWYLRSNDGGAPSITLDELRGEGGILARRMVKGFIVSLAEKFDSNNTEWWRTTSGLVTPANGLYMTSPPTEFHGWWFTSDSSGPFIPSEGITAPTFDKLPIAFVIGYGTHRWSITEDKKHVKTAKIAEGAISHFMAVQLTDTKAVAGGLEYWETSEGWWLRAMDATKVEPGPKPAGLEPGEKWIEVNLKKQTLIAFEGDKPVFATLVSSGRKDHDTPPGTFRIREKHIASTMDGDADVASDGPYSIEDVPYIQYFNAGYALHGAFWHSQFGRVKSHGCVNLAPWDARALFAWTGPSLPEGWHGVWSTKEHPGTLVVVR